MNSWLDQKYIFTKHKHLNKPNAEVLQKHWIVFDQHLRAQADPENTFGNSLLPSWTKTHVLEQNMEVSF